MKAWNEIVVYFEDGSSIRFTPKELEQAKMMKEVFQILQSLE